jgi:hypothetical protein
LDPVYNKVIEGKIPVDLGYYQVADAPCFAIKTLQYFFTTLRRVILANRPQAIPYLQTQNHTINVTLMNKQIFGLIGQKFIRNLYILKALLFFCNIAAITIYILVRALFHDYNIQMGEDVSIFSKTILIGTILGSSLFTIYFLTEVADVLLSNKISFVLPGKILAGAVVVFLFISLASCSTQISAGIKKDFTTGLTAKYHNVEPGKVMLVMNGEVLNHTDIPLGESFVLVNDNVKGLKEKDGKVNVGCSLVIKDKNGKELLNEPDLLNGDAGLFGKDITYLKCAISTGAPMEWEETYAVNVTFWDKNGNGKIENNVSIRAIDMP